MILLRRGFLFLLAAWSVGPAGAAPAPIHKAAAQPTAAEMAASTENAATLARLTQSNQDLLDLLKKQQAVLEDIQYERRLQNRQISSLEERLEEAMQQNAQLEAKVARLEAQIAVTPATAANDSSTAAAKPAAPAPPPPTPAPPASYLPAPEDEGAPGTKSWHRLFTLSGTDGKNSDLFHIEGRQWRVLWHNQDRTGTAYANTSALFINAFPKNDTVPQKVCSKLGTGGASTELDGPGNYYLKVEASGGSWELAVEDFK
jgi:TolA-binding protein